MTVARTLKKLLLGETWLLPLGLAAGVAATLVIRHLIGSPWHQIGGFVLLGAVAAVVVVSVSRSAGRR